MPKTPAKEGTPSIYSGKDKLLTALVYFIVHDKMSEADALKHLEQVLKLDEPVLLKVKL